MPARAEGCLAVPGRRGNSPKPNDAEFSAKNTASPETMIAQNDEVGSILPESSLSGLRATGRFISVKTNYLILKVSRNDRSVS